MGTYIREFVELLEFGRKGRTAYAKDLETLKTAVPGPWHEVADFDVEKVRHETGFSEIVRAVESDGCAILKRAIGVIEQ